MNPKDFRYTKEHEWIDVKGDIATIGITSFAQEQLGDIVSVEFSDLGKEFSKGESMALIDSMKTTSDVYAPVSGEVVEVNRELEARPELINEDPFGEGWIVKMKIKNPSEVNELMNVMSYEELLKKEGEGA